MSIKKTPADFGDLADFIIMLLNLQDLLNLREKFLFNSVGI